MRVAVLAIALLAACGGSSHALGQGGPAGPGAAPDAGGGPAPAGTSARPADAPSPSAGSWIRQLGGAGNEHVLAVATGANDGGSAALTVIGEASSPYEPEPLVRADAVGVVRLDTGGNVTWSAELPNDGRDELTRLSLALSPAGNALLAVTCPGGCPSLGASGAGDSVVVKLEPPGTVAWRRVVGGGLTARLAVDGAGSSLVAYQADGAARLRKYASVIFGAGLPVRRREAPAAPACSGTDQSAPAPARRAAATPSCATGSSTAVAQRHHAFLCELPQAEVHRVEVG